MKHTYVTKTPCVVKASRVNAGEWTHVCFINSSIRRRQCVTPRSHDWSMDPQRPCLTRM